MVNERPSRANRVRLAMMNKTLQNKNKKPFVSKVAPTLTNRFFNLFSNKTPLPVGSLKKTSLGGKRLANENLRALSYLSNRSLNTVKANLKTMKNKKNRKTLQKELRLTRRK